MCGIFGVAYRDTQRTPDADRLEQSLALLGHRGPDGRGHFAAAGVGLAHTRLSLLDPSVLGAQPLWDPERRFCLVYNGELYNYRELRAQLEARGSRFRGNSDTEVLLHLLIEDGPDAALPQLEGMFAFACYDAQARSLMLARDRLGIKPLHVYEDDEKLLFASEVRALRPWISLEADAFAVSSFLISAGGAGRDQSFYEGVRMLPAGGLAQLQLGASASFKSHARLADLIDPGLADELASYEAVQLVDRVESQLQDAVDRMLVADTPVGALCSGGVDSSLIMAMAARRHGSLAIFHADVVGPASERRAAEELAQLLGLELRAVPVLDRDFITALPVVMQHYEHPFSYHPNSVPFLRVSQLVGEHGVKAVLSGEGSDECYLGYDTVVQEPIVRFVRRQLARMERVARAIPALGLAVPTRNNTPEVVAGMLGQFDLELEGEDLAREYGSLTGASHGPNLRSLVLLARHLRTLLHRNDRLGMAAGIEARFPFLDEPLLRTAVNLPPASKIRWSTSWHHVHPFLTDKWVLREVARRHLPRSLSHRRKLGFPTTAFGRLRVPASLFEGSFVAEHFQLSERQIAHLLEHADQKLAVALLHLEVWARVCLLGEEPEAITPRLLGALSFRAAG